MLVFSLGEQTDFNFLISIYISKTRSPDCLATKLNMKWLHRDLTKANRLILYEILYVYYGILFVEKMIT